jgi:hypothetical protein
VTARTETVVDERALEQAIAGYLAQGFTVVNRAAGMATLRQPKQFNLGLAILGFLFCGVGLLVYLIVYSTQSDQVVELRVGGPESRVTFSGDGRWWWDGQRWQDTEVAVPPGVRRSDDGAHWWDGTQWRPVPPSERRWTPEPPPQDG